MSFVAVAIAGGGLALGSTGMKAVARGKANKDLRKLQGENPVYSKSPYASQQFALANSLFNAKRMAGAGARENNIFASGANFQGNVTRNASDATQALSLAAGGQQQTNDALGKLQIDEAQNQYSLLGNLNNAYGAMIGEDDKVYGDKVRRYGDKVQIQGAINENKQNMWGDFAGLGMGALNIGLAGMGGNFGGGGSGSGGGGGGGGQTPSWGQGQYQMMQGTQFNPRQGSSPASAFNIIPFNPARSANSPYPFNRPQMNFNYGG